MKIKGICPCCNEVIEIEINEDMEVISVEHLEKDLLEISNEETKKLLEKNNIELA